MRLRSATLRLAAYLVSAAIVLSLTTVAPASASFSAGAPDDIVATAIAPGASTSRVLAPPAGVVLENSFVSAVGWVKPGAAYPSRVFVKNYGATAITGASVSVAAADGMRFATATPLAGSGTASVTATAVTWTIGDVPAATAAGPAVRTLVIGSRAKGTREDPRIVWKDLSTVATLTYTGGTAATSRSRGPKVIPEASHFDTARYGYRPFPVVPVDYQDRKHTAAHTGEKLTDVINSPDVPGSTFNLYQEMSYGQLFPEGTVPSSLISQAGWGDPAQWHFTTAKPPQISVCTGRTYQDQLGSPTLPDRINGGWYQLPGDTHYYGADQLTTVGAIVGVASIDNACGPTGKAVYDAAHIADPEIDYSDYDTDKDGVVDFFMMVFAGLGGNGVSQRAGYDNIWPHSSSLEFYYRDPATGLAGYVSSDQLRDYSERPLYFTDANRVTMTATVTEFPVFVRVGPYNVNPEAAIDHASVIAHEYGHSLGLPDFYSASQVRPTYGDWNLMATDKSQNMDVFSKQELGWLIPRVLKPGETVANVKDSKLNTHRIDWVQPDGTPYTLQGPNVNNGEAYVARLPGRRVIDPGKVARGASPTHIWHSGQGDDFGCPPNEGHNLDIVLPELASVAPGTAVTLTLKSLWDIEWDWDFGFVMVTSNGSTYQALPSQNGYTTRASEHDPNGVACYQQFEYGLTGTSASYALGTQDTDRVTGAYADSEFIEDRFDLSAFAGAANVVLRFSYFTDPAVARPGWFIDDVKVTAGPQTVYSSDFETANEARIYNGGCRDGLATGPSCTEGWNYVDAASGNPADHAYYLELRDRSGFDFDGRGQNDRAAIGFQPGLLVVYTDESHGMGNYATPNPPAQSPLDSTPHPLPLPGVSAVPEDTSAANPAQSLNDAAFTAAAGRNQFSDAPPGRVDNYSDPSRADSYWRFDFDCLTFDVLSMAGDLLNSADSYDLRASVRFRAGAGCAPYSYGAVTAANFPPTVVIQVKPSSGNTTANFKFDGSLSIDDSTPREQLTYAWDFGDGTTATGSSVRHKFAVAGNYTVTLTVTDADGLAGTATRVVQVKQ